MEQGARSAIPRRVVVVMTAFGAVDTAVGRHAQGRRRLPDQAAQHRGARRWSLERALERRRLRAEAGHLRERLRERHRIRQHRRHEPGRCRRSSRPSLQVAPSRATRAHHRRERHRQGADRRGHPRAQPARRQARSSSCTAPRSPRRCSRASCSATSAAPSPARWRAATAASSRPTAARCSSTRSARSRPPRRSSCCASCRSASSSASAATRPSRSTSASSPRPTATCKQQVKDGTLPRGPLLPAQRGRHRDAAAARARRGHPARWPTHFLRQLRQGERQARSKASPTRRSSA